MYVTVTIRNGEKEYDIQTEEHQKIDDVLSVVENALDLDMDAGLIHFVKLSNPPRVVSAHTTFLSAGIQTGETVKVL